MDIFHGLIVALFFLIQSDISCSYQVSGLTLKTAAGGSKFYMCNII